MGKKVKAPPVFATKARLITVLFLALSSQNIPQKTRWQDVSLEAPRSSVTSEESVAFVVPIESAPNRRGRHNLMINNAINPRIGVEGIHSQVWGAYPLNLVNPTSAPRFYLSSHLQGHPKKSPKRVTRGRGVGLVRMCSSYWVVGYPWSPIDPSEVREGIGKARSGDQKAALERCSDRTMSNEPAGPGSIVMCIYVTMCAQFGLFIKAKKRHVCTCLKNIETLVMSIELSPLV